MIAKDTPNVKNLKKMKGDVLLCNTSQKTGGLKLDSGFLGPQDPVFLSLPCYLHLWSPSSGQPLSPGGHWSFGHAGHKEEWRWGRQEQAPAEAASRKVVKVGAMGKGGGERKIVPF